MTLPRGSIVVTGTELVRGDLRDENGPFLARELLALGIQPARVVIVGDRYDELRATLSAALDGDLCVVSGGLGPTHDDRTVEILADIVDRPLRVDSSLVDEISAVSRRIAERLQRPYVDFDAGVRKQATLPEGATVVGVAGTAPAFVLEHDGCTVVVLPGPPGELRRMWAHALASEPVRRALAHAAPLERRTLRTFGISESAVARALADAGGEPRGVEATICARDYEIHVDLVFAEGATRPADQLADALLERLRPHVFARDGRPVEEIVLGQCRARGFKLAVAESCTGGLVAARLTDVAGASDVFVGGVVAYSDTLKRAQLGVPADVLDRYGAVSAETGAAMSRGASERLGAEVAVAVTGVAGPGGGTPDKPVGLVYLHVRSPDGEGARALHLRGGRDEVRRRATVAALHLVREVLAQDVYGPV